MNIALWDKPHSTVCLANSEEFAIIVRPPPTPPGELSLRPKTFFFLFLGDGNPNTTKRYHSIGANRTAPRNPNARTGSAGTIRPSTQRTAYLGAIFPQWGKKDGRRAAR